MPWQRWMFRNQKVFARVESPDQLRVEGNRVEVLFRLGDAKVYRVLPSSLLPLPKDDPGQRLVEDEEAQGARPAPGPVGRALASARSVEPGAGTLERRPAVSPASLSAASDSVTSASVTAASVTAAPAASAPAASAPAASASVTRAPAAFGLPVKPASAVPASVMGGPVASTSGAAGVRPGFAAGGGVSSERPKAASSVRGAAPSARASAAVGPKKDAADSEESYLRFRKRPFYGKDGLPAADALKPIPGLDKPPVVIYTDGACSGNPGPAGLGVVMLCEGTRRELSEYLGKATSNIAELTAILRGLERVKDRLRLVVIHSDSQYSLGVLGMSWKVNKNQELVSQIVSQMDAFPHLRLVKVAGHAGVPENERCDQLARAAITRKGTVET